MESFHNTIYPMPLSFSNNNVRVSIRVYCRSEEGEIEVHQVVSSTVMTIEKISDFPC